MSPIDENQIVGKPDDSQSKNPGVEAGVATVAANVQATAIKDQLGAAGNLISSEQPMTERNLKKTYLELPGMAVDPNNPFSEILVRPSLPDDSEKQSMSLAPFPQQMPEEDIPPQTIVTDGVPDSPSGILTPTIAFTETTEEKNGKPVGSNVPVGAAGPEVTSSNNIMEFVSFPSTADEVDNSTVPEQTPEEEALQPIAPLPDLAEIKTVQASENSAEIAFIPMTDQGEKLPAVILPPQEVESVRLPSDKSPLDTTIQPIDLNGALIVPPATLREEHSDNADVFNTETPTPNNDLPLLSETPVPIPPTAIDGTDMPGAKPDKKVESDSSKIARNLKFHRIMFMSTALTMGIFLLAITLFLGGGALEERASVFNDVVKSYGETKITLLSGDNYYIRGNHPLFGGEIINVKNGSAEINFGEGSTIRLRENTQIRILQISPHVVITMDKGEIWVLGNRSTEVRFKNAVFYARSNSARFTKENDRIIAASYRHPLFTELFPASTDKKAFFAIPSKKRIKFSEESISRSLPDLHFSKLKKEILFSEAEQDQWAAHNIVDDNRILSSAANDLKLQTKTSVLGKSLFASMKDIFVVFPERKQRDLSDTKKTSQAEFLSELLTTGTPNNLQTADLSDESIDLALSVSNLIVPNKNLVTTNKLLQDELKKRNHFDSRERLIAQNSLSMLEDAMNENDPVLAESIISSMTTTWQTSNKSPENKVMLEMYREIIADLFRRYINLVTPSMLQASSRLDSIAISWGQRQMAIITTLEIIAKNLETADTFLEKSKLDMAKGLLDINDVLFKVRPTLDLIASFDSMQNRQEFLKEKYAIFKTQGWLSKDELFELLKKREDAQRILLYMEEEQKKIVEMNTVFVADTPLADRIREDFINNKLQIVSMIGAEDENAKTVDIIEAILPDGERFSGEYLPDFKVIRNVVLEGEKSIQNDIKLTKLIETIDSLRTNTINSIGEDLRELRTKPLPKLVEDPISKMDPIVIEVTRRLNQAVLAQKGFNVPLKNVILTSPKTIHVTGVAFEDSGEHTLEFDIDNDTKQLSKVVLHPENTLVDSNSLDTLSAQALVALDKFMAKKDLENQVEWALLAAGLTPKTAKIVSATTGIYFENGKYHDWTLSGLADPQKRTFIIITKGGKDFLKNVSYDVLGDTLLTRWQAEEKIKTLNTQSTP